MMVRILTLLFALALVVSCGLKHPQSAVSGRVNGRSVADIFEDQHVYKNTSISQCLPGSQLAFDVNATLQESTRLNRRYFACPKPEPGVPCFLFKDLFYPFFALKNNISGELESFTGSYTFKIIGGGPYSRSNIHYYSEEEILKINSFNDSVSSEESLVWMLHKEAVNFTKEGFVVMNGSINWVRWVCQKNSPCGDLTPEGLLSPDFFFIIEVSNREVDKSTYCEHSARFELHVHGLPLLPDRALFYVGMTMMTVFSILCVLIVFSSCRSRRHTNSSPEHDSLSVDEDESRDEFQADDSSVKCLWTRVEQIYDLIFNFTQTPLFTSFILFVVVLDTTLLIAQAFPSLSVRAGWVFSAVDACFLGIYLMEFFLKLLAWGHKYFQNSWNNMDLIIIVMSVVDFTLPLVQTTGFAGGKQTSSVFRALKIMKGARAIRAFRLLKAIRSFHTLQLILATAVKSLRSIGSTSLIMLMVISMFTIFLRVLYSETDPERFGGIFSTITTLFQVLTLDDWALVYNTSYYKGAAHIMIFLVSFIIIENLILLNIILAVLVDNLGLTINRTNQKVEAAQEDEAEFIRKIELEISESKPEEESDQESLRRIFSGQKHSKRKVELMADYLRLLASMEQSQFSIESEAFLLNKLVESSFKGREEETNSE